MSNKTEHLFLYTIGPVQSFIASARKTQDLWASSYLLSHLVNTGLEYLQKKGIKYTIIFPGQTKLAKAQDMALLPNRFLFHIKDENEPGIKDLGEELTKTIEGEFKNIIAFGVDQFSKSYTIHDFSARQVKDFLETYWVAVPFIDTEGYKQQYEAIETALAGRKNLKIFEHAEPEASLKCSMCGEREAIHPDGIIDVRDVKIFWGDIAVKNNKFNKKEYLCSICLAKRFLPNYFKDKGLIGHTRFPSTAEIAAASYKAKLLQNNVYKDFEKKGYKQLGRQGYHLPLNIKPSGETLDAHWFYEENYTLDGFQSQDKDLTDKDVEKLKGEFLKLQAAAKKAGIRNPSKYYAVLTMDGDHMGKKIQSVVSMDEHKKISEALSEFAGEETKKIVEEDYLGKLIYAGGDDVLALVNIDDLFPVMEKLRIAFAEKFNKDFGERGPFTASCGVCISHYKNPFSVTLRTARDMEKLAKSNNDILGKPRKAFAIQVLSHSGNNKMAVAKWESLNGNLIPQLDTLKDLLNKKVLSDNFIYAMKKEFSPLMDNKGFVKKGSYIETELKRLMWRAVDKSKLQARDPIPGNDKQFIMELASDIFKAFNEMGYNLENFISLLEITNIINREAVS